MSEPALCFAEGGQESQSVRTFRGLRVLAARA